MTTPLPLFSRSSRTSTLHTALVALAVLAGCSSNNAEVDDPSPQACPAPTGAGTMHQEDITENQTWKHSDGPHFVKGKVAVRDGATLTIEPCVEVRMAAGASLDAGVQGTTERGVIEAKGDEKRPIRFLREGEQAFSSIGVFAPSKASLAHASISGAGSDPFREKSSIFVVGDGKAPGEGQLLVDQVRVEGSEGHGVVLTVAAAFVEGSRGLVVKGSGSASVPYPLVVGEHALDRLPDGDLTGNHRDEILVREDLANGHVGLQVDATMRRRSVPYHIGTEDGEPLRIGGGKGGLATLTIEAGTELRFHPGVMLRVQASPTAPLGALKAMGTATSPVRFSSASDSPKAGDWAGLYFESPMADANEIAHAIIEHAGGYCSCSLVSCSPIEAYEAAIVLDGEAPSRAFLRDSVIRDSARHGILRSWLDHEDIDFLASNSFERLAGCKQTTPMLSGMSCPDVKFSCEQ